MQYTPALVTANPLPLRPCGLLRDPAHAPGVEALAAGGTPLSRAGSRSFLAGRLRHPH